MLYSTNICMYRFPTCRQYCFWLIGLHRCSLGRSKLKLQQCSKSLDHPILFSTNLVLTSFSEDSQSAFKMNEKSICIYNGNTSPDNWVFVLDWLLLVICSISFWTGFMYCYLLQQSSLLNASNITSSLTDTKLYFCADNTCGSIFLYIVYIPLRFQLSAVNCTKRVYAMHPGFTFFLWCRENLLGTSWIFIKYRYKWAPFRYCSLVQSLFNSVKLYLSVELH